MRTILPVIALIGLAGCTTDRPVSRESGALLSWAELLARPRPTADATISYGMDRYHKVDVWLPRGKGPHKTVVMVHGGCWTSAVADRTLMDWAAADLRDAGYAVWNIDYRGVDAGGGYPGTFVDAGAAVDAMRTHAARFGLDMRRIVAVGHSAGGHLALWLAARPKLPQGSALRVADPLKIAHVVSLGGLPDLERTTNGCGGEAMGKLVAGADPADRYRDTSVARLLPIGVPHDHVAGLQDPVIPIDLPTDFVAKAQAAGDRAMLHPIDRTGHFDLIGPGSAAWVRTRELISDAFVK